MAIARFFKFGWTQHSSTLEVAQGLFDMTLLQPEEPPPELFGGYERNSQSDRSVQYFSTAANDLKSSIIGYQKIVIYYRLYHIIIDLKTVDK